MKEVRMMPSSCIIIYLMTVREEIIQKVQELPESSLAEVHDFVEKVGSKQLTLMERLRRIRIQGPPDFARNIDLYLSGEKTIDEDLR